jgi:hypothetical protein
MFASGQIVSQKLLASDEAGSFLEVGEDINDYMCGYLGCDFSLKGNGVCDKACRSLYCYYDGGDCAQYDGCFENGCTREIHGDGTCNESCDNLECEWDKGECELY